MNEFLLNLGKDVLTAEGGFVVDPLSNNTISILLNSNLVQLQSNVIENFIGESGPVTDLEAGATYKVVSSFMPSSYNAFISLEPSVAPYPSVSRVVREKIGDLIFIVYGSSNTIGDPVTLSDFENLNSVMGSYVSKSFSMQYGRYTQLFIGVISNDYNALDDENTLDYLNQIEEDYNITDYTIIRPGTSQSIRKGFLINSVENGTILNAGVINPPSQNIPLPDSSLSLSETHHVRPPAKYFSLSESNRV